MNVEYNYDITLMPEPTAKQCKKYNMVNKSTKSEQVNRNPPQKSPKIIYRITRETHSIYIYIHKHNSKSSEY